MPPCARQRHPPHRHDRTGRRAGRSGTRRQRRRRCAGGDRARPSCPSACQPMKRAEKRSAARLAASQALYQMEIADKGLNDILAEFEAHWLGQEIEGDAYTPADLAFFRDVVSGVQRDQLPIDRALDDTLAEGWPLKRVEALMRAILRAALYELRNRPDVPARVAVTEYVDVAAAFFGPDESGMINAVLDALARQTRPAEFVSNR